MLTTAYTCGKAMGYSSEDGGLWNYIQPQRSYSRLDFDRTPHLRAELRLGTAVRPQTSAG